MICPNCGLNDPKDPAECPGCGLIFAKWRERHPDPVAAEPATTAPEPSAPATSAPEPVPGPEASSGDRQKLLGVGLLLVVGLGVIAFGFFKSPASGPKTLQAQNPVSVNLARMAATQSQPMADLPEVVPTPLPTVTWRFEGRVVDCLHQTPISGVTLLFDLQPPVEAVTGPDGRYQAEVAVSSTSSGCYIWLKHPDYGAYQEGDLSKAAYRDRIQMYGTVPFQGSHRGVENGVQRLDFSMFPVNLTPEEQRTLQDTLYPPARD